MIHLCTIKTRTQSGTDDFGEPTYTWADTTNIPCRLVQAKRGTTVNMTSGEFVTGLPRLLLKISIDENNLIEGTSGFSGTYKILKVAAQYDSEVLHHYAADLQLMETTT